RVVSLWARPASSGCAPRSELRPAGMGTISRIPRTLAALASAVSAICWWLGGGKGGANGECQHHACKHAREDLAARDLHTLPSFPLSELARPTEAAAGTRRAEPD